MSKQLCHSDLKSKVVYRKWAQKGKEEALTGLWGHLQTLLQSPANMHSTSFRCPRQGREETEGSRKDSTEIHTKEVQIFCHHPINMSWAYKTFLKSRQEKPYMLSYPELSCCFIFYFLNSKIQIILYHRLDTNSGNR